MSGGPQLVTFQTSFCLALPHPCTCLHDSLCIPPSAPFPPTHILQGSGFPSTLLHSPLPDVDHSLKINIKIQAAQRCRGQGPLQAESQNLCLTPLTVYLRAMAKSQQHLTLHEAIHTKSSWGWGGRLLEVKGCFPHQGSGRPPLS